MQGLRISTVEKNDLAVAIRTVGEELASAETNQSSPNFKVVVEGTSRNLHPILRDEVYRLAAEALRNAFRHAGARNRSKLRSATTKSISGCAFGTMEKGLAPRFFAETDVRGTTACAE